MAADTAPLGEKIPAGLVPVVEQNITDAIPGAVNQLGTLLKDGSLRQTISTALRETFERAMRQMMIHERLIARLVMNERTMERVLTGLERTGVDRLTESLNSAAVRERVQGAINRGIHSVLERPLAERIAALGAERVAHLEAAAVCVRRSRVCVKRTRDAGASTGGFTDCVLQRGAAKVYAYDVGTNQLAWKLRSDERVVSREGVNLRYLTADDLPEPVDLVVVDVSFISLTLILGPVFEVLRPGGDLVCLIKPQFEAGGPGEVGKKGVVKDAAAHQAAVASVANWLDEQGWAVRATTDSPIAGGNGNLEFLLWAQRLD